MPILGLCADVFRVDIDFQPLGLKSDRKKGGFWGLKLKNLNLHIFITQTIQYKYALNIAS
jgi:hypothetical protein